MADRFPLPVVALINFSLFLSFIFVCSVIGSSFARWIRFDLTTAVLVSFWYTWFAYKKAKTFNIATTSKTGKPVRAKLPTLAEFFNQKLEKNSAHDVEDPKSLGIDKEMLKSYLESNQKTTLSIGELHALQMDLPPIDLKAINSPKSRAKGSKTS